MAKQTNKEEKKHFLAHHQDEESTSEKEEEMEQGELDEDLETKEGRQKQVDEDEIEPWEEGFVEGASDEGQLAKDALTGKPLMGGDDVVELEFKGKVYRFLNEKNAQEFKKKRLKEKKK
ncbi:hypothetical protein HYX12_02920 [Candidatus Woesearchaeota archaeon]|nr:hypothetical protein [Candidatus Woesearchaeota archaeon]